MALAVSMPDRKRALLIVDRRNWILGEAAVEISKVVYPELHCTIIDMDLIAHRPLAFVKALLHANLVHWLYPRAFFRYSEFVRVPVEIEP